MASPKETKPHAAIILAGRRRPPGNMAEKFTDTELEVAENLVLLSESSSGGGMGIVGGSDEEGDVTVQQQQQQHRGRRTTNDNNICRSTSSSPSTSSSMSSVNTTLRALIGSTAMEDDAIDEESTGPWARIQKYRSINDVYSITRRIDAIEDQKTKRRRKRASKYDNTQ